MDQKKQVVFVKPDQAPSFELKNICIDQLLPKEACSQFSAYRVKMKPHQVKKTSYHKVGEELYYVLEGSGVVLLGNEEFTLTKGCFFRVPPKTLRQFITRDDLPRSFKLPQPAGFFRPRHLFRRLNPYKVVESLIQSWYA